jgi:hypothetical protein
MKSCLVILDKRMTGPSTFWLGHSLKKAIKFVPNYEDSDCKCLIQDINSGNTHKQPLWRSTTRTPVYKDLLKWFNATITSLLVIKHVAHFRRLYFISINRNSHGPESLSTLLAIGWTSGVRFLVGENNYIGTHTIPGPKKYGNNSAPKEKTGPEPLTAARLMARSQLANINSTQSRPSSPSQQMLVLILTTEHYAGGLQRIRKNSTSHEHAPALSTWA